ncbi:MAG: 16S rRNA (guanine(527)-N(7))-methyltransferase RsmG [Gammaproteobacteria bacterium]|nr:16S rRNA (guanine(527)-N(7))-methyltransferase RsmG [Gammaproteobacteria bacterium]
MTSADLKAQLVRGCAQLHVELLPGVEQTLLDFIALLAKWNTAYNLTAIRAPTDMVSKHLLDSLSVLPFLQGNRIVDVACGAGLPGIPLALACPDRRFVLLDSQAKKTRFVTHAIMTLGLRNVEVVHTRAEDYRPLELFATVVSRAFASLLDFVQLAGHLGAPQAVFLAMKGQPPAGELQALPAGCHASVHPLTVPGLKAHRCVVEIHKNEEVR